MSKKDWLNKAITELIEKSPENSLQLEGQEPAFGQALIGYSRGDDPLYGFLKKDIGKFYWRPDEAFLAAFPKRQVEASQLSVICWILPQTKATKEDHRKEHTFPCERWSRARLYGEEFNTHIRRSVVELLQNDGYAAVAPVLLPSWKRRASEKYGFASTWSERHTAFVCGLGTFGLSDGLITPVGKAVRIGSVIADIELGPSSRPYLSHTDYCLFYTTGKCMQCAKRCPAGAISAQGHDKERCKRYIREKTRPYVESTLGLKTNSCGLCQVGVPCESRVPGRKK